MTEDLEQLLKNLKLRRILKVYDEQLRAAEQADVSYSEFVAGLLRAQWHERLESALEWRIGRANLPERLSLETFPYARQTGVNRMQIRAFAELDFVASTRIWCSWGQPVLAKPDSLVALVEGLAERPPLPVRPRAGSVRRNVCVARRSFHSPVAEPLVPSGRPPNRRIRISES